MQLTLYHAIIQEKNAACQSFEKIIRQLFSKIGKISKYESETGCNERKYFQNHQNIYFLLLLGYSQAGRQQTLNL